MLVLMSFFCSTTSIISSFFLFEKTKVSSHEKTTIIVCLNFDFVLLQFRSKKDLWEINNNQKVSDSFVCYFVHFQKGQETSGKNNCFGQSFWRRVQSTITDTFLFLQPSKTLDFSFPFTPRVFATNFSLKKNLHPDNLVALRFFFFSNLFCHEKVGKFCSKKSKT